MNIFDYVAELNRAEPQQVQEDWQISAQQVGPIRHTKIERDGKIYLEIRFGENGD